MRAGILRKRFYVTAAARNNIIACILRHIFGHYNFGYCLSRAKGLWVKELIPLALRFRCQPMVAQCLVKRGHTSINLVCDTTCYAAITAAMVYPLAVFGAAAEGESKSQQFITYPR